MINQIICGDVFDVLKSIPENSVDCVVTSPPYYNLRDYGNSKQIGLENTSEEYISKLVSVFQEIRKILKDSGTLWVNIGDTYLKTKTEKLELKNLIGIPWKLAFALQDDGWILRQDIIWHKPNPMPESVKDRCVKSHEYIFLLSKTKKYYFNCEAIQEPANYDGRKQTLMLGSPKYETLILPDGVQHTTAKNKHERWKWKDGIAVRNKRSVWSVPTKPYKDAHFAVFPELLVQPIILAGCPEGGIVLDPFCGSGTVGVVCRKNNRSFIGIDINPEYCKLAEERIKSFDGG